MIDFFKYEGTGNDFILIDNRNRSFQKSKIEFAKKWCDRRFGIGSDGLIFIEPSDSADFYVDFYNPDGSQSFCGNGSRCAVRFASFLGIVKKYNLVFEAIDGLHDAIIEDEEISIHMKNVESINKNDNAFIIHTGSPHFVWFDENSEKEIVSFGREVRYSEPFAKEGINVNLVRTLNRNHIQVKTYERGVEDETFSCGTGVTACALAYASIHKLTSAKVTIDVKGGRLHVKLEQHENGYQNIWLQGPAKFVYQGIIDDSVK